MSSDVEACDEGIYKGPDEACTQPAMSEQQVPDYIRQSRDSDCLLPPSLLPYSLGFWLSGLFP